MKAALVIMAAGMGSRYGGSKQVDGIGPNGEILMEYSVFDALRAGFTKVVFIIKPEMRELMEELVGKRLAERKTADGEKVEVCYAYQDFSSVPSFYQVPEERVKPFGTVHALLCARECVSEPFVVINADDYYGIDAYRTIYEELIRLPEDGKRYDLWVKTESGWEKQDSTVDGSYLLFTSDRETVTFCVQERTASPLLWVLLAVLILLALGPYRASQLKVMRTVCPIWRDL